MTTYISRQKKIYYSDMEEFLEQVNKVIKCAEKSMPVNIRKGSPEFTTTLNCSDVYYYISDF